jgi:DNA replication protein DnaC
VLKHPTLDQLHALGLQGMAKAFADIATADQAKDLPHADWLALLLDRETSWRRDKRLTARLRAAKLRQQASVEDVDYRAARGLDRALFQKLANGECIDAHDNLALVGPSGVGKSWLACAIGQKACRDNRSVLYHRWPKLCEDLALARGDGRHPRLVKSLGRADLLILDDFGLEPSTPAPVMTCSKSSRRDTGADRRSSPLSFPCPPGMMLLGTQPTQTPSWTASSTTLIASS